MEDLFSHVSDKMENFSFIDVLDILLIFTAVYIMFIFFKRNNASIISKVLPVFIILASIVCALNFEGSIIIIRGLAISFLIFIAVIFKAEFRRAIWRISSNSKITVKNTDTITDEEKIVSINEIVKACLNMAKNDTGAIIVVLKNTIPEHVLKSGVTVESFISSQLLESIFNKNAPLHDGAVIIKDDKIISAGCFLPLSQELNIPKELGTRHRAGIGISEAQQVLSIVVSEETGIISIAEKGKLERYIDSENLKNALIRVYGVSL